MKIIVTEAILSPEEFHVLLCEIKAETEVAPVGNMGKSVMDVFKEAEFRRQQREFGKVFVRGGQM